jgi:hypothetical protein
MAQPDHRVRIRDGEREVEVSGNPAFVRQVLDDLPSLMARLRGVAPGRTAISMPAPPELDHGLGEPRSPQPSGVTDLTPAAAPPGQPAPNGGGGANGRRSAANVPSLEERVFEVLRGSGRPLAVAAIRQRLDGADVTGQQVRRLLERAGPRVVMSAERPATYSLR